MKRSSPPHLDRLSADAIPKGIISETPKKSRTGVLLEFCRNFAGARNITEAAEILHLSYDKTKAILFRAKEVVMLLGR